jgi:hypothetical protein
LALTVPPESIVKFVTVANQRLAKILPPFCTVILPDEKVSSISCSEAAVFITPPLATTKLPEPEMVVPPPKYLVEETVQVPLRVPESQNVVREV